MYDLSPPNITLKYQNVCLILCEPDPSCMEQLVDTVRTKYRVDTELIRELFGLGNRNYNVDQKGKTDTVSNFIKITKTNEDTNYPDVKIEEVDTVEEINDNSFSVVLFPVDILSMSC